MHARAKEFIRAHRILIIGIGLYISIFIVKLFFNPIQYGYNPIGPYDYQTSEEYTINWLVGDGGLLNENKLSQLVPLDFLIEFVFFGFFDLWSLMNASHIENWFLFPCVLTWAWQIKGKIISIKTFKPAGRLEKMLTDHFYDGPIIFILFTVMRFLMPLLSALVGKVSGFAETEIIVPIRIFLIVCALAGFIVSLVFIFIPSMINGVFSFAWMWALGISEGIANLLNSTLLGENASNAFILLHVVSYIMGIAIIIGANILIERLFELIQSLMFRPVDWIIKKVVKSNKRKQRPN